MKLLERFADVALEAIALSTESRLAEVVLDAAIQAVIIPFAALVVAPALLATWHFAARRASR